jgi:hypothetical protein
LEQKDILFHSQIVLYETVDTAIEAFYVDECNLIEPGGSLRFSPQLQSINPKKGVHPLKSHTFFAIVHYRRWNSCKLLKSASQPIARMVSGAMPDAVQFARLSFMPLSHFSSAGIVLGQNDSGLATSFRVVCMARLFCGRSHKTNISSMP